MRGVTPVLDLQTDAEIFQLTRLMRGVTIEAYVDVNVLADFNSHASCEA